MKHWEMQGLLESSCADLGDHQVETSLPEWIMLMHMRPVMNVNKKDIVQLYNEGLFYIL